MEQGRARRTTRPGVRWFVRVAAIVVGLANLRVFVWVFGYPSEGRSSWLLGAGVSLFDALPSVLAVVIAALVTSELSLRRFGENAASADYALRRAAALRALCIGGALTGALLSVLWALDGTMGADPPAGEFASPLVLLAAVAGAWRVALLGAGVGFFFGFLQGAVLAFPLASALGRFGGGGQTGDAGPVRPSRAAG